MAKALVKIMHPEHNYAQIFPSIEDAKEFANKRLRLYRKPRRKTRFGSLLIQIEAQGYRKSILAFSSNFF